MVAGHLHLRSTDRTSLPSGSCRVPPPHLPYRLEIICPRPWTRHYLQPAPAVRHALPAGQPLGHGQPVPQRMEVLRRRFRAGDGEQRGLLRNRLPETSEERAAR
jgi:hypothetical protein